MDSFTGRPYWQCGFLGSVREAFRLEQIRASGQWTRCPDHPLRVTIGRNGRIAERRQSPQRERPDRHERLSRHRHRHVRHENPGHRRARGHSRLGPGNLSVLLSQAPLERTRPRRLVEGHDPVGPQDHGQGQAQAGRRQGDRALRPDARLGVSRQKQQGHSPGDPLERPADRRRMCRNGKPRRRPGESDQAGGQSRHDRLHRPENPLAAEPRAATFRENPQGAAAERRNAPPSDRRVRHRSERRQRHVAVGRCPSHVVEEAALRVGVGRRSVSEVLRVGGSDRPAHARGGEAAGIDDRLRGGGRGRRLRRRGRGQRHRRPRRALDLDRHLRRHVRSFATR